MLGAVGRMGALDFPILYRLGIWGFEVISLTCLESGVRIIQRPRVASDLTFALYHFTSLALLVTCKILLNLSIEAVP
jgi:hypothetical protein